MTTYYIKKTSNGEYTEIEKNFKLNLTKYVGDQKTLYFDVEGQDIPFLMDCNSFFVLINNQIQGGLVESLEYQDGVIKIASRDGNILKKYTYDFGFKDMEENRYRWEFDFLKRSVYKIISLYTENPNSSLSADQKYSWLIYGILDGDRIPIIENKDELLKIFQVYNGGKSNFLKTLLENVVFCDENGRIIEYDPKLRVKMLKKIKYDVYQQMEIAMLVFVAQNEANDLYKDYLENTKIPRREISYKYYDEDGNEIEAAPEMQGGNVLSIGIDLIEKGLTRLKDATQKVLERKRVDK